MGADFPPTGLAGWPTQELNSDGADDTQIKGAG